MRRFTYSDNPSSPARETPSTAASPDPIYPSRVASAGLGLASNAHAACPPSRHISASPVTRAAIRAVTLDRSSPRNASAITRSAASSASAAPTSHGPIARSTTCVANPSTRAPATIGAATGSGRFAPKFSACRPLSGPYSPGGCFGDAGVRPIAFAGSPTADSGGADSSPYPSSVSAGANTVLSGGVLTPADNATSRRNISTNSPDNGRFDQSAFAVTWNSTTRPAPRAAAVTSGVPSASVAQVCPSSVAVGSASTCRLTVTSAGTASPANGEAAANGASPAGAFHDNAPPNCRSPLSSFTGSSGSLSPIGCSAVRGPANRTSSPPFSTHAITASRSGPAGSGRSARTKTEMSPAISLAMLSSRNCA